MSNKLVKINVQLEGNKDVNVYRTTNDINGNPRYIVHFLTLDLKKYESSKLTKKCGLKLYHANNFGGGFIFQSYNLTSSLEFIFRTLQEPENDDKIIGVWSLSAFSSIVVFDVIHECEDYYITAYSMNEIIERKRKNKVFTDSKGENYINKYNTRYYLSDCMRVNN